LKCTVNSAARKCLAVHTGFGNETFCRREKLSAGGLFLFPEPINTFYYKEENLWSSYGLVYCLSHGSRP